MEIFNSTRRKITFKAYLVTRFRNSKALRSRKARLRYILSIVWMEKVRIVKKSWLFRELSKGKMKVLMKICKKSRIEWRGGCRFSIICNKFRQNIIKFTHMRLMKYCKRFGKIERIRRVWSFRILWII